MHTHGGLILSDFDAIHVIKDVFIPEVEQRPIHLRAYTPLNLLHQIVLLALMQDFHGTGVQIGLDL